VDQKIKYKEMKLEWLLIQSVLNTKTVVQQDIIIITSALPIVTPPPPSPSPSPSPLSPTATIEAVTAAATVRLLLDVISSDVKLVLYRIHAVKTRDCRSLTTLFQLLSQMIGIPEFS